MTDRTDLPTTDEVREEYVNGVWNDGVGPWDLDGEVSAEFNAWFAEEIRKAVDAERERCARIAEMARAHGVAATIRGDEAKLIAMKKRIVEKGSEQ